MNNTNLPRVRAQCDSLRKGEKRNLLETVVFAVIMLVAGSAYAQFVLTPVPGLPPAAAGSIAWGDYDNDGRGAMACPNFHFGTTPAPGSAT